MVIGDIIRTTASRDPNKIGVIFGDRRFTWQEVNSRTNSLANGLLKLGLRKGDRIAILSRACNEYMEFNLATAKVGLVQVALNHWSLGKELLHPINDSGARALIVHRKFLDRIKDISPRLDGVEYFIGIGEGHPYPYHFEALIGENSDEEPQVKVDGGDLYCLCYTSGTTGRPKGTVFSHDAIVKGAYTLALESQINRTDVFLMIIPFCFASHGASRFHAVLVGATCVILNFEAEAALKAIERERVTYVHIGPTALRMALDHPNLNQYDVSSLRRIWVTGGALPASLWERADEVFGPVAAPTLGMTECLSCEVWFDRRELAGASPEKVKRLRTSVGKKCVGVDIRVVAEDGSDVTHDGKEVGEIIIRSDMLMKGYWNLPQETAKATRNGWLYTDDLVSIDEDGYVFFVDRKREMIKSGGIMIFPLEIEELIRSHPAVLHCAVIGVPHEKWGETPKALVMLKPGMKATGEEIMELCKKNMASYKKPSSVEIVDNLPFTVSGKINRAELKKRYWEGQTKSTP